MIENEYELHADVAQDSIDCLARLLRSYNRKRNPVFFAARELPENALRPIHVVVFESFGSGKLVGGLIGETQFAWLKISIVVVLDLVRGRGLGRRLVAFAEQEAIARGCRHAYLDTMDYQAPGFYEKLGYEIAGKLDNWDSHGHTKFLFTKQLTQP